MDEATWPAAALSSYNTCLFVFEQIQMKKILAEVKVLKGPSPSPLTTTRHLSSYQIRSPPCSQQLSAKLWLDVKLKFSRIKATKY